MIHELKEAMLQGLYANLQDHENALSISSDPELKIFLSRHIQKIKTDIKAVKNGNNDSEG